MKKKIAFLMNAYVLQESPTIFFLGESFIKRGYEVTIFIDRYNPDKYSSNQYREAGIKIISPIIVKNKTENRKVIEKNKIPKITLLTRKFLDLIFPQSKGLKFKDWLISFYYSDTHKYANFLKKVNFNLYDFIILIEPEGVFAYYYAKLKNKYIYLSLELHNLASEKKDKVSGRRRNIERKHIEKSMFVIIQDYEREQLLRNSHKISKEKNFVHLPVSIKGEINKTKSDYLYKKFNIPSHKKIILYAGSLVDWACVLEVAQQVKNWDDNYVFVIHGGIFETEYLQKLKTLEKKSSRIFISTDWLSYEDLDSLIMSSSYIGMAVYKNDNINNAFTTFASGKIATYLKSGIPVITYNFNSSYAHYFSKHKCGECINNFADIKDIILKIDNDYSLYRKNSFSMFSLSYNFESSFKKILKQIEK